MAYARCGAEGGAAWCGAGVQLHAGVVLKAVLHVVLHAEVVLAPTKDRNDIAGN